MENLTDFECHFDDGKKLFYSINSNTWTNEDSTWNLTENTKEYFEKAQQCLKRCLDVDKIISNSELAKCEDIYPIVISRKSNKQITPSLLDHLTVPSSPSDSIERSPMDFPITPKSKSPNASLDVPDHPPRRTNSTSQSKSSTSSLDAPHDHLFHHRTNSTSQSKSSSSFDTSENHHRANPTPLQQMFLKEFGWATLLHHGRQIQINFNDGIQAVLDATTNQLIFSENGQLIFQQMMTGLPKSLELNERHLTSIINCKLKNSINKS